jgi:hypothetical protein
MEYMHANTNGPRQSGDGKTNGRLLYRRRRQEERATERFHIRLDARDPTRNHFRAYRIEAGTDLSGEWLVRVTLGSVGRLGTRIRAVARDEIEARGDVRH